MLVAGLILSFATCDKDKDNGDNGEDMTKYGRYYKLYKKKWYNLYGQARGDHYFNPTDSVKGTFQVEHPYLPDYSGNYQWYPSGDSMLVEIDGAYNTYTFNEILDAEMNYSPANEPNNVYYFSTDEP